MNRTERFYKIEQLLKTRPAVPLRALLDELEVSESTVRRDLDYLRDRLHAPIVWDRGLRGYRLDPDAPPHELPGLWFDSAELHALLTFHHLLDRLEPGLLSPHIRPLQDRIRTLLGSGDRSFREVARRIRVLPLASRRKSSRLFQVLVQALLKRRRLTLVYYSRARDDETAREVSPQRLVHYRDNWYLDAWDHGKRALRSFAVDAIRKAAPSEMHARALPDRVLDAELGSGYGIFAGRKTLKARLRFTPERARWVAHECWHPKQRGYFKDGSYLLEIPYADDRELTMDILKYGPDVEVLGPVALKIKVLDALRRAVAVYEEKE
jgi:predicted DNA-binding transcriptional regulator YafY